MEFQIILNELRNEGWYISEEFIEDNKEMLQALVDKTISIKATEL